MYTVKPGNYVSGSGRGQEICLIVAIPVLT
jgi:hypothetical protein